MSEKNWKRLIDETRKKLDNNAKPTIRDLLELNRTFLELWDKNLHYLMEMNNTLGKIEKGIDTLHDDFRSLKGRDLKVMKYMLWLVGLVVLFLGALTGIKLFIPPLP